MISCEIKSISKEIDVISLEILKFQWKTLDFTRNKIVFLLGNIMISSEIKSNLLRK
eukprot:TRINITY_DN13119_c0_g1_i1.p1 TRINITY_DN13119_c0_g1~~TRINITY_DN13119_c0_g1_i1.p1  ORF type:complete len:56 (+),score=5.32 TRINITY_DN13119_c0_g1_i1:436-603(+)